MLKPHDAWAGYVGNQTPAEFVEINHRRGITSIDAMCEAYVADIIRGNVFDLTNSEKASLPANLVELLAEYIRTSLNDA